MLEADHDAGRGPQAPLLPVRGLVTTFISKLGSRAAPIGREIAASRKSWTAPTTAESSVERGLVKTINDHFTEVGDIVERGISLTLGNRDWREASDAADMILNRFLPAGFAASDPHFMSFLVNGLTEEIVNQAAQVVHDANLTADALTRLDDAHVGLAARAQLSGAALPSQTSTAVPPSLPPPPTGWVARSMTDNGPEAWMNLRMDLVNPYAVDYASRTAMNLAGRINRETLDSVQSTIANGYRDGWTVEQMADVIQTKVGLFPRWSNAVDAKYTGMLTKGLDPDFAMKQAQDYADSLRGKRAMMIARTETMRASNYGRMAAYKAMGGAGIADTSRATKTWLAGPNEADRGGKAKVNSKVSGPCDICDSMDGIEVSGLDGLFTTSDGQQLLAPPAHPHCRCTITVNLPDPEPWDDMGGQVQWMQDPGDLNAPSDDESTDDANPPPGLMSDVDPDQLAQEEMDASAAFSGLDPQDEED